MLDQMWSGIQSKLETCIFPTPIQFRKSNDPTFSSSPSIRFIHFQSRLSGSTTSTGVTDLDLDRFLFLAGSPSSADTDTAFSAPIGGNENEALGLISSSGIFLGPSISALPVPF